MDLLSIESLSDGQIAILLDAAQLFAERTGSSERLAGKVVFNIFYENSTRTAMSFAMAAARLGAQTVTLSVEHSSVKKGETLADTALTLDAMRPDAIVMRHRDNRAPHEVAEIVNCPVINAGDGTNEHPTQALLDALTLRQHFGSLTGRTVAIVGDIRHSRVARSNARLLPRLGVTVRLAGPPALMPDDLPGGGDIEQAISGADAVMMLRVQRERMDADLGDAPGEFLSRYGLTEERLALAAPHAVVLHPGPMNRGVEIADSVADGPRSLIRRQVANGVAVRMAVLEMLLKA
ncbi:aspartate carbamoyltransferase catalytic subunit [Sphingomonas sp. KRR8]|uniref:aspartate carbamoyltransferase catalytic subunit n=1 Tax=Sphingomonas sp. KRR8 TaxID=2942996 RepID=UPI002022812C|nr:aspartate carbamoyltransferase catalytic subunit [Sphingomonas sp. KRR8]URD61807.1 aspartate carbamoyltransferase catalytic subunit [Sphingomonas sp. KRR8]